MISGKTHRLMKPSFLLLVLLFCTSFVHIAQSQTPIDTGFDLAFKRITAMLEQEGQTSLKAAVFAVENAYLDNRLDEEAFNTALGNFARLAEAWLEANHLQGYTGADSVIFARSGAVFKLMTDTIFLAPGIPLNTPFRYDPDDFFGAQDWTNMFVTKLLATGKGNCHSMPILYKLLCDELGVKSNLALAPTTSTLSSAAKRWAGTTPNSPAPPSLWILG